MDVAEIVNTLADFSNLEAELLIEEIDSCSREIGKIENFSLLFDIFMLSNFLDKIKKNLHKLDPF